MLKDNGSFTKEKPELGQIRASREEAWGEVGSQRRDCSLGEEGISGMGWVS